MLRTLLISILINCPLAFAEYRAYELSLVNQDSGTETPIISVFDHIQYPGYYPLLANESVIYVDSWMCPGNTSNFKPICPKPEEQREPAASTTP